ncbi:hypothetical protein F5Y03DRAFT_292211 [Xylaria venustula]|nr:hypothetical protein F5Y03DRAFT_292211 [Xylaria venustula]
MKVNFASTIASLSLLTIGSAYVLDPNEKLTLSEALCQNIHLTDNHILHATCTNIGVDPRVGGPYDLTLNLDDCFANYEGTLSWLPGTGGGFSSSCKSCHMVGTKLACQCETGLKPNDFKYNEYELDNWRVLKMSYADFNMRCVNTFGMEKRARHKAPRHVVA